MMAPKNSMIPSTPSAMEITSQLTPEEIHVKHDTSKESGQDQRRRVFRLGIPWRSSYVMDVSCQLSSSPYIAPGTHPLTGSGIDQHHQGAAFREESRRQNHEISKHRQQNGRVLQNSVGFQDALVADEVAREKCEGTATRKHGPILVSISGHISCDQPNTQSPQNMKDDDMTIHGVSPTESVTSNVQRQKKRKRIFDDLATNLGLA
ncbi:hypothetical protein BX600DRAFT_136842 [Xylariales sp. PMI_506]|nr:hypothetical protein BX600DRAFT_136842 [Xylariales sp. PMI_506]